jgi:hypothetical protein
MWKFVVVELYCGIYWDYDRKSSPCYFRLNPEDDDWDDLEEVENTDYDPIFPKPTPPAFCKKWSGLTA